MSVVTKKEISDYIQIYGNSSGLTFTKEVIQTLGLDTRQIFLKIMGNHWPCIIYSCSMNSAKVLVNLKKDIINVIKKSNNLVNLRFYFQTSGKDNPIAFFVTGKVTGWTTYNSKRDDLCFLSLTFTQRPPDDLVYMIGRLLDANEGYKRRREERIEIDPISIKRLGLKSKISFLKSGPSVIKCILRDISFSGAQIITPATANLQKESIVHIAYDFEETSQPLLIAGKIIRTEVIDANNLHSAAILYNEDQIPLEYKMAINEYLKKKKTYLQERSLE